MKLVKCQNCKNEINFNETICPFCKEPIKRKIEIKHVIIIIIIAALIGYQSVIAIKESKKIDNINLKKMYCTKINNSNDFISCTLLYNYIYYLKRGTESYDGNDTVLKINKHKYKIYAIDDNIIEELKKKKYIYAMISTKRIHNLSKKNKVNLVGEFAISKKDITNMKKLELRFIINNNSVSKEFDIKDIEYKEFNNYEEIYKEL